MGVVKTVNSGLKCFADDGVVDTYEYYAVLNLVITVVMV